MPYTGFLPIPRSTTRFNRPPPLHHGGFASSSEFGSDQSSLLDQFVPNLLVHSFVLCDATGMSATPRPISERLLCYSLRYLGFVSLLALVAVFMPYTWMDTTHRWLGLGELPTEPVVGYLARSLSLFYSLMGGLLLVCSFDLHRHRAVLLYMGAAFVCFGIVMWGVDLVEGMPGYWKHTEGPMVIAFGSLILALTARLRSAGSAA